MLFWIGLVLLVIAAVAAALAAFAETHGQNTGVRFLAAVVAAIGAIVALVVVFWLIASVWSFVAGWGYLVPTPPGPPQVAIPTAVVRAQVPVTTVTTELRLDITGPSVYTKELRLEFTGSSDITGTVRLELPTPVPPPPTPVPSPTPVSQSRQASPTTQVSVKAPVSVVPCPKESTVHKDLNLPANAKVVKTGDQWSTPSEPCKFQIQAVGIGHVSVTMDSNYQFTTTEYPSELVKVYYGDGIKREIEGATVRFLGAYPANHWVWDPKNLLSHEFNFGWGQQRNPRYVTMPGNFEVDGWESYAGTKCPKNTVQVAALVGGSPNQWKEPTSVGGAWVFKAESGSYILLTAAEVPGAEAWLDYWNGQKNVADVLNNWASLALSEASFHCSAN